MSTIKATNLQHGSAASPNLVLDSSGNVTGAGTLAMASSFLRNRIINGDMRIDQRNAGAAQNVTASTAYCVDRWVVAAGAAVSGTLTAQRVATNTSGGAQFCLRLARTSGTYTSFISAGQVIESANCYDLAGRSVTVSFRARRGAGYTGTGINSWVRTGTGADQGIAGAYSGSWTGWAQPSGALPTTALTTDFQTFSYTVTIPANVQEIAVAVNTENFTGSGTATDFVEITDVQLEIGSVATPFERRQYGQELALCKRYYYKLKGNDDFYPMGAGRSFSTTGFQILFQHPVWLRANPTVSATNVTNFQGVVNGSTGTVTSLGGTKNVGSDGGGCPASAVEFNCGTISSSHAVSLVPTNSNVVLAFSSEL